MKRYGNLWDKIIAPDNLAIALQKAKRHKSKHPSVIKVCSDADYYLNKLHDILASGNYKTALYHNKLVFEPKLRLIYALPFFPDRIFHHAIMNVLEPVWDRLMFEHSYSCRKGYGQHKASYKARKYVMKYKYCAQLDISQFYVNIDHELLKECIRRKIKDTALLKALDEIIDSIDVRKHNIDLYRKAIKAGVSTGQAEIGLAKLTAARAANNNRAAGVAVGNLVSQWFGNLFLTDTDYAVKGALIRFCDDILLFDNDKNALRERVQMIDESLRAKRLSLSKSRVFPTSAGVDFCGYKSYPNGVTLLRKTTAKRKKREMRVLPYRVQEIGRERATSVLASAYGLLKHANAYNFRKRLGIDAFAEALSEAV